MKEIVIKIIIEIIPRLLKGRDKYYYNYDRNSFTTERCRVKGGGFRIGSISCKKCEHCKRFSTTKHWIICKKIKEATGNEN